MGRISYIPFDALVFTARPQDALGEIHDYEILLDRTRQVQTELAASDRAMATELGALVRSLEDACRDGHAAFLRDRHTRMREIEQRSCQISRFSVPPKSLEFNGFKPSRNHFDKWLKDTDGTRRQPLYLGHKNSISSNREPQPLAHNGADYECSFSSEIAAYPFDFYGDSHG